MFSSHFSRIRRTDVLLQWRFGGIDFLGWMHDCIAGDQQSIAFPHLRVELAKRLTLRMPQQTMLYNVVVVPVWFPTVRSSLRTISSFSLMLDIPPRNKTCGRCYSWTRTAGTGRNGIAVALRAEQAFNAGAAYGGTRGFFEYKFPVSPELLRECSRLTVLCECLSHVTVRRKRIGTRNRAHCVFC